MKKIVLDIKQQGEEQQHGFSARRRILAAVLGMVIGCAPYACASAAAPVEAKLTKVEGRTVGHIIDDVALWTRINESFLEEGNRHLFARVKVTVKEGLVLLMGSVPSEKDRLKAVSIAKNHEGVQKVIDELEVVDPNNQEYLNPVHYARDAAITSQVRAKMLLDKSIHSPAYTIETVRGVVYITGVAQTAEELAAVETIARGIDRVERVVSHVRVGAAS